MAPQRAFIERGWIVVSIMYGALRASLVWAFLRRYGVNPWIFIGIEMLSSGLYGWTSAKVVTSIIDSRWRQLRQWAPLAAIFYIAPDAYVFASAGHLPGGIFSLLISIVGVTVIATGVGIVFQVRSGRRAVSLRTTTENKVSKY